MADQQVWLSVILEDGTTYYYHSVTGESSWDPPAGTQVVPEAEWLASHAAVTSVNNESATGVAAQQSDGHGPAAAAAAAQDGGIDDWQLVKDDDGQE
jgi:hypothetical protein